MDRKTAHDILGDDTVRALQYAAEQYADAHTETADGLTLHTRSFQHFIFPLLMLQLDAAARGEESDLCAIGHLAKNDTASRVQFAATHTKTVTP